MKIIHRVSLNADSAQREFLLSLGFHLIEPGPPLRLISFDIEEDHPQWPRFKSLIVEWQAGDFVTTEFSTPEICAAERLKITPAWHHGYPMPDGDFGYLNATYDLKDYCEACGIGKVQVAPFRMKNEPKWGKRNTLQLNWVFDEFFVTPAVWEAVFKPFGVGGRAVIHHRTGKELTTVVQLDIQDVAKSALAIAGAYPSETCPVCGRTKYLPIARGFFPSFQSGSSSRLCRTREYFGSGASAWNAIIVTREVYLAMRHHSVNGVTFVPLAEPSETTRGVAS